MTSSADLVVLAIRLHRLPPEFLHRGDLDLTPGLQEVATAEGPPAVIPHSRVSAALPARIPTAGCRIMPWEPPWTQLTSKRPNWRIPARRRR